jgi:hypothetical protein
MAASSLAPQLTGILEAIEHIDSEMAGVTIDGFEADWRKCWLVERGVEIISEGEPSFDGVGYGDSLLDPGGLAAAGWTSRAVRGDGRDARRSLPHPHVIP